MTLTDFHNDILSDRTKKVIIDTDTYNEIDDQYAVAYAMLSPEKIKVEAICAAPFLNSRSKSAEDGMIQSYNEIFKITKLADKNYSFPIYEGSRAFLPSIDVPVESEAADKIAEIVLGSDEPVYIIALGAITNVASAIIKHPEIVNRTAIIWLGGQAFHWTDTPEFNLMQDVFAARVVFDSGIPLLQIPCRGVCSEFLTTIPELEYYIGGKNNLCDYLLAETKKDPKDSFAWSKQLWDVTAVGVLTAPEAFSIDIIPRPIIADKSSYATDNNRPLYLYVKRIKRDPIYADMFRKIAL